MYSARNSSASSSSRTSSTTPESWSTWQPCLKRGTLGAYDEALSFVRSHSESLRSRMSMLESDHAELSASERAQLKESLEIASLINLPWIVSAFEASSPTHYDASNPALRHLRERVWRNDSGVLAKLMQRCTLMHVFPDVIAGITPLVDVSVAFGHGSGYTDHSSDGGDVLAGVFVEPKDTVDPPTVSVNVFHQDVKLYTLALVDPDQPDEPTQSYKTSLLALKTDIALSATTDPIVDLSTNMAVDYIPPHPQQGTQYHRYTTVLFEQSTRSADDASLHARHDFDVAAFAQRRALTPAGIHFWRAKWTPQSAHAISTIYATVLNTQEPRYTSPPSLDRVRKQLPDTASKWFA